MTRQSWKRPSTSVKAGALMILCRKKLLSTQMARKNRKRLQNILHYPQPSLRPRLILTRKWQRRSRRDRLLILQKCFPVKRLWRNLSQDFRISNWLILPLAIIRMYRKARGQNQSSVQQDPMWQVPQANLPAVWKILALADFTWRMVRQDCVLLLPTRSWMARSRAMPMLLPTLWNLWARKNSR